MILLENESLKTILYPMHPSLYDTSLSAAAAAAFFNSNFALCVTVSRSGSILQQQSRLITPVDFTTKNLQQIFFLRC
jgi:hypothetical protein